MASLPTPGSSDAWGTQLNTAIESLHLGPDTHANRPTTGLVKNTLYSCTDHNLIYRWSGSAWATYATLGSTSAGSTTFTPVGNIAATNVQAALQEVDSEKAALTGANFTGLVVSNFGFDSVRFRGEGGDSGVYSVFHATVGSDPTKTALSVKGVAGQTADLVDVRNASGTQTLAVTPAGRLKFNALDGTAALGAYQGYVTVTIGTTAYKMPVYA